MNTDLSWSQVQEYVKGLVPARPPTLQAMEESAARTGFPIVGPPSGQLCYLLTRAINATRIYEMGSGFGYSTAWFARGVQENGGGTVHHVVWDEDLSERARHALDALGYGEIVEYHVSEAIEQLAAMDGPFDLIFNDINKQCYPDSLPVIAEKLRPGGLLIVDNMLWNGRVFDESDHAASTEGVREFTRRVVEGEGWIASLVPIRDGLILAYRR